jgi:hypothetical protein
MEHAQIVRLFAERFTPAPEPASRCEKAPGTRHAKTPRTRRQPTWLSVSCPPIPTCAAQFFRGLPEAQWSPALNAKLLEIANTKVAMYDAYASEMEETARDEDFLKKNARSLGNRPLRVLTTGYHAHGFFNPKRAWTAQEIRYEQDIQAAQARWLKLSTNAKQMFTSRSSEYTPFDDPGLVVSAIREVYDQSGTP